MISFQAVVVGSCLLFDPSSTARTAATSQVLHQSCFFKVWVPSIRPTFPQLSPPVMLLQPDLLLGLAQVLVKFYN